MILLRRIRVVRRARVVSVTVTEVFDHSRRIAVWQEV